MSKRKRSGEMIEIIPGMFQWNEDPTVTVKELKEKMNEIYNELEAFDDDPAYAIELFMDELYMWLGKQK